MNKIKIYLIVIMLCGAACSSRYSEGSRVGNITKFSKKGLLIKSWEGEMVLGGVARDINGGLDANIFKFSVEDPSIVKEIQEAMKTGKKFELIYRQSTIPTLARDSSYIIEGVKEVNE